MKRSCPLNDECLTPKIIYGVDTSYKEWYRNHKPEKYENNAELRRYNQQFKRNTIY